MDKKFQFGVPHRAVIIGNQFRKGLIKGRETLEGTTTHELGGKVQISDANLGDKRYGKDGVYVYDIDLQTCHELPDDYVVIVAPHGNFVHIYAAQYDPEIDGHLPIYFLTRSGKR